MGQERAAKKDGDVIISFKELSTLLNLNADDIEEWVIEAMNNKILDAKID